MYQTAVKNITFIVAVSLLALLTACGNNHKNKSTPPTSSSSSSGSFVLDLNLGNVQVHFPPPVVTTQDDSIIVRGKVVDTTDVVQLFINGSPVTTTDALATWQAEVPLTVGQNALVLTKEDADGAIADVSTLTVNRESLIISPKAMVMDTANNRFLIWDNYLKALIAVDATTGIKTRLSPVTIESNNLIENPRNMVLDPVRNRVLLYAAKPADAPDTAGASIAAVDLTTGEQSWVTFDKNTDLVELDSALRMVVDESTAYLADMEGVYVDKNNHRLAKDDENAQSVLPLGIIYNVDLSTGTKSTLASFGIPDENFIFGTIIGMATSHSADKLYVIDQIISSKVFRLSQVDKATGATQILNIKSEDEATSLSFTSPKEIVLDDSQQYLYILDSNKVKKINLETLHYSNLAGTGIPADSKYLMPKVEAMTLTENKLHIVDDSLDYILDINTDTGLRTQIAGAGKDDPNGTLTSVSSTDITLDAKNNLLYSLDKLAGSLTKTNLLNGEKSLVLDPLSTRTEGESFLIYPLTSVINYTKNQLFVLDNVNQRNPNLVSASAPKLLTFAPETTKVSATLFFNNTSVSFFDSAFDEIGQSLYTVENNYIRKIDLSSGSANASIFSAYGYPNQNYLFKGIRSLAIDYKHNRLLVADVSQNAIVAVSLIDGNRTQFSNPGKPVDGGPIFSQPKAIVVDEKRNRALVLDSADDSIIAVDLETGHREVVVTNIPESYNKLYNPQDMDLHPAFDYVVITDDTSDTLMAVDLLTNQKVMLSR